MGLEHTLVKQKWLEIELGWGHRPDGYSLHKTLRDCERFVASHEGKHYDCVSKAYGKSYTVRVDKKTYKEVSESECGIWYGGSWKKWG